ncbi:hypothetical protein PENSPDRAFT_207928 [Peniophora sp. CONT]|nr:hypothetical protein PENSPDRAFT_207928 [Peniophora sp. CONT]
MLRNASDVFVQQCMSRKFLDALEDVLTKGSTSPVVKERLLDVLAAAAYASQPRPDGKDSKHDGFRSLWKKLKPPGRPEEGYPFDNDDAMFLPPAPNARRSMVLPGSNQTTPPNQTLSQGALTPSLRPSVDESPRVPSKELSIGKEGSPKPPPLKQKHSHQRPDLPARDHSSHSERKRDGKNRIIPPDEDIRRLFQECKFAHGNAALLNEALAFARPEDLEDGVIREFHDKCRNSQELILAQIPWASAGADRSRQIRLAAEEAATVKHVPAPGSLQVTNATPPTELTVEEQLLAALLEANEVLVSVLRVYEDLERVGIEREAEEISKRDVKIDRSQLVYDEYGVPHLEPPPRGDASSSRSPSPGPISRTPSPHMPAVRQDPTHPLPHPPPHPVLAYANGLAVPPPPSRAPAGPRSPGSMRTPSPEAAQQAAQGFPYDYTRINVTPASPHPGPTDEYSEEEARTPVRPSAKALGKRPARAPPERAPGGFDPDDIFFERTDSGMGVRTPHAEVPAQESDDELVALLDEPEQTHVRYAYDAVAERTQAMLEAMQLQKQQGSGQSQGTRGTVPMGVH